MSSNHNEGGCSSGSCSSCGSSHAQQPPVHPVDNDQKMRERMGKVKHKLLVFSGKGGVGKSSVAVNLAVDLQQKGYRVGLLDVDVHGPSVPTLLGLERKMAGASDGAMIPVMYKNLKVISIGFLMEDPDSPVIWRGPLKMGVIKQFLEDVHWGELDYLIIDAPPGTGDEPLSVAQLVTDAHAIVVTTPQKVSTTDVRKSINFCHKVNMPILGVVENMSGMILPSGERVDLFGTGGGKTMAAQMNVPFLGDLPIDPLAAKAADEGKPFVDHLPDSPLTKAFAVITETVAKLEPR